MLLFFLNNAIVNYSTKIHVPCWNVCFLFWSVWPLPLPIYPIVYFDCSVSWWHSHYIAAMEAINGSEGRFHFIHHPSKLTKTLRVEIYKLFINFLQNAALFIRNVWIYMIPYQPFPHYSIPKMNALDNYQYAKMIVLITQVL